MHNDWTLLDDDESDALTNTLYYLYGVIFDPEKTFTKKVELSFFPGYHLIESTLSPQAVEIKQKPHRLLNEKMVFLCLIDFANPKATNGLILLSTRSAQLYEANGLLDLTLTEKNLIDYIKYFGYVIRSSEKTFHFISSLDEIIWKGGVADPKLKERLIGAIDVSNGITEKGTINIVPSFSTDPVFGTMIQVKIPCIYYGRCFAAILKINDNGFIEMYEDRALFRKDMFSEMICYPCYNIFTGEKIESVESEKDRMEKLKKVGCVTLIASPFLLSAVLIGLLSIFDVFTAGSHPQWSLKIRSFLTNNSIILFLGFIGSVITLGFMALSIVYYFVAKFAAKKIPGTLSMFFNEWSVELATYATQKSRLKVITKLAIRMFLITTFCWSVFLFSYHELFGHIYISDTDHGPGNSLKHVLKAVTSNFFTDLYNLFTMQPEESNQVFTPFGKILLYLLQLSIVYFVIKNVLIVWNARSKE